MNSLATMVTSLMTKLESRTIVSEPNTAVNNEIIHGNCRAPLHEECPKHHGHKRDPGVTPGTCGAVGKRAQVILVWMRAPGVGNASHPRTLGGMRVRP